MCSRPATTIGRSSGRRRLGQYRVGVTASRRCRADAQALYRVGLGWIGLTLVNAVTHIVTSIRFRIYNPGLITSIVLFLPFTICCWWTHARGAPSGADIVVTRLLGVVLHCRSRRCLSCRSCAQASRPVAG